MTVLFDVLITDISLPDLPGTVLATRLQQRSAHLWIVFCSGYSVAHGLSAWGRNTRALRKPFEADELHALVQEIRVDRAPPE